jgi:uncharacterized hydrophobic protein (TIGR00271 family)
MNFKTDPGRQDRSKSYRILVAVHTQTELHALLSTATAFAGSHECGEIRVITVTRSGNAPSWFTPPVSEMPVEMVTHSSKNVGSAILNAAREYNPDLLLLGTRGPNRHGRYLLGRVLDPVVQGASCDIVVQREEIAPEIKRILIPAAGGPNAPYALKLARRLAPEAQIVTMYVAEERLGQAEVFIGEARLRMMTEQLSPEDRAAVETKVRQAATPLAGILEEATEGYDLLLLGARDNGLIDRFLFGDIPQVSLDQSPIPIMVVRRRLTHISSFWRRLWAQIYGLVPPLTLQEQAEIQRGVRRGSQPSPDFFITLTLAAILAGLGLLMNNAAVIIGAMIVAPLMTAILGMGLSIVLGDLRFFGRAAATTSRGVLIAIVMGFLVGQLVPGASPTDTIVRLTQPTILDLAVALTAGIAAAYAVSRREVSATLAGIAIATSLAPPLVNIGLGLAFRNLTIALGAALIFSANLVAIVATSGFVFIWMGFRPQPGNRERTTTQRRGFSAFGVLLALITIPFVLFTSRSIRDAQVERAIKSIIVSEVGQLPGGEISQWNYHVGEDGTLNLDLTVRVRNTVTYESAREIQERIASELGRPVALSLEMIPVQRLRAYVPPTDDPVSSVASGDATPTPLVQQPPVAGTMEVTGSGTNGLAVRYAPNGMIVGQFQEGVRLTVLRGPVDIEGIQWYRVACATTYLEGWVDGAFLAVPLTTQHPDR